MGHGLTLLTQRIATCAIVPGMVRPTRRMAGLLLWLLLALLPLRGLAHGWMGLAPLHDSAPAALKLASAGAMPCHGQAVDGGAGIGAHAPQSSGSCVMCDLCHAVLALPQAGLPVGSLPATAPCPCAIASPPAHVDGGRLFRPPRA
jgi:hypothetical protein